MTMTPAERARKYRQRIKESGKKMVLLSIESDEMEVIDKYREITGRTRSQMFEDIITTWICDAVEALPKIEEFVKRRNELNNKPKEDTK